MDEAAEKPVKPTATKDTASIVDYLPDANTLPKPGTLLLKPPYHLFIHAIGNNKLEIQCSHSATLEVLSDYLKRWCRINPNLTTKVSQPHITRVYYARHLSHFGAFATTKDDQNPLPIEC